MTHLSHFLLDHIFLEGKLKGKQINHCSAAVTVSCRIHTASFCFDRQQRVPNIAAVSATFSESVMSSAMATAAAAAAAAARRDGGRSGAAVGGLSVGNESNIRRRGEVSGCPTDRMLAQSPLDC